MAKPKWDQETIIKRILALQDLGEDLTCSHVKDIDSALVGAAISYFGNWGAALEAAGLNYAEIRKISKSRRREKVSKWTVNKVLEEIRQIAEEEEDISYTYMKEKHSSLVAAASNYVGSWQKAVEMVGLDYDEVKKKGRKARVEREKAWYRELLIERLRGMKITDSAELRKQNPEFHKLIMSHFKSWSKAMEHLRKKQE